MKKIGSIMWGIVLVAIGIIIALNSLEITNIDIFFDGWWTLFIIIPSLIGLFSDNDKTGSIIGLIIGIMLLLVSREIIDFEIVLKLIFPCILITIGLSIIFKDLITKKISDEMKNINQDNNNYYCSTFREQKIECDEVFEGCNLDAIFGSNRYNLENAKIKKDVVINVSSIFGSNYIIVPKDVNVKIKSKGVFGDTKNKTNKVDSKHTIYINSLTIFGEVIVK